MLWLQDHGEFVATLAGGGEGGGEAGEDRRESSLTSVVPTSRARARRCYCLLRRRLAAPPSSTLRLPTSGRPAEAKPTRQDRCPVPACPAAAASAAAPPLACFAEPSAQSVACVLWSAEAVSCRAFEACECSAQCRV